MEIPTTIEALKRGWNKLKWGKGGTCPVCERWGKVAPCRLTPSMVKVLIWMYKNSEQGQWIEMQKTAPRFVLQSNSHAKMVHWGLVQCAVADGKTKKNSGIYRITNHGRDFVELKCNTYVRCWLYNKTVAGWDTESGLATIEQILETKGFEYQEVMLDIDKYLKMKRGNK